MPFQGRRTYAEMLGAKRASSAQMVAAGYRSTSRGYVLPGGDVISHRAVQERGATLFYGKPLKLETRPTTRQEVLGEKYRNPRNMFDAITHFTATGPRREGGMGLVYDERKRVYRNPRTGQAWTRKEIRDTPAFTINWEDWHANRKLGGKRGARNRRRWLIRAGKWAFDESKWGHYVR